MTRAARIACAGAAVLLLATLSSGEPPAPLPFARGERITLKITYAHLLAGRAWLAVEPAQEGGDALDFVAEARSQGFFAWLFRFRVDDRTVARWQPGSGCSLRIEKRLREGRARRDQVVRFDPATGVALVEDPKIEQSRFDLDPCTLDILSAFFVTRVRGVPEDGPLELPVFDNGKRYLLGVRFVKRERLNLPLPLGPATPTLVVEPQLVEGTGLFVKEKDARLKIWLTDDARRIPVRLRSKVAIGSVSADLEAYQAGGTAGATRR